MSNTRITKFERMMRKAQSSSMNRRTLFKGAAATALGTAVVLDGSSLGMSENLVGAASMVDLNGITLKVFTQTGPFISGPIKAHAPEFQTITGGVVEAVEAPNADLFARAQQVATTGSGDFDILLLANTWMPDFVNLGYVVPLQPWIDKDVAANDEQLAWDDIPDGIKRKNSWAGQINTFIVDNDNQTMFYRKDVLSDPKWQEAYNAATGKDLPNPPQTLTELIEVAKFFSPSGAGAGWSDAGEGYGFITCVLRGQQSYWYSYPWTAPYSVIPTDKAPNNIPGIYLFDPDMNPLINTPGYVRGVTEFVDVIQNAMKPGLDADRATVIEDMINGTTIAALDWGDTGPASVSDRSVVKNKLGFAQTPGTMEYYDWTTDTWVTTEALHQTPTHAYNGWSYYITNQTKNADACWEWIKWHASPGISAFDVASPDSGYQPWRMSHSTNLEPWVSTGWDEAEAKTYIEAILGATDHPNAVFDPRIPGAARYQETLELYTNQAIAGELAPQEAMDKCATEFNAITDELGRDKQIAAYRAHLGWN